MTLEFVYCMYTFTFLFIGIVAVYLGEMQESFFLDKNKIGCVGEICSGVATIWLFIPFLIPLSGWVTALMFMVALVFYGFMFRFYRKSRTLSK